MASIASLVHAFHDIDKLKERTCGNCFYNGGREHTRCRLGHKPAGADDGCEDFRGRPVDAWKAWPVSRQPEAARTHQRPGNEAGGGI